MAKRVLGFESSLYLFFLNVASYIPQQIVVYKRITPGISEKLSTIDLDCHQVFSSRPPAFCRRPHYLCGSEILPDAEDCTSNHIHSRTSDCGGSHLFSELGCNSHTNARVSLIILLISLRA